jgi:hypothetical protein
MMTFDETMQLAGRKLDVIIEDRMVALEARIRADIAATGPEDEEALDRPPDPDSPWQRITVEEVMMRERDQCAVWKVGVLAMIRHGLEHFDELPDAACGIGS